MQPLNESHSETHSITHTHTYKRKLIVQCIRRQEEEREGQKKQKIVKTRHRSWGSSLLFAFIYLTFLTTFDFAFCCTQTHTHTNTNEKSITAMSNCKTTNMFRNYPLTFTKKKKAKKNIWNNWNPVHRSTCATYSVCSFLFHFTHSCILNTSQLNGYVGIMKFIRT